MKPYTTEWFCSECNEAHEGYDEADACCDPVAEARLAEENERRAAIDARRALEAAGQMRLDTIDAAEAAR